MNGEMAADPTRVVADSDVLAADLFVDGPARAALDVVRSHSWVTLVASDQLLADAEAVITACADATLAADWREYVEEERDAVDHPNDDHPALASAYHGEAAHLLTFDESLRSLETGLSLQPRVPVSVRSPDAFVTVFDAESLYEATHEGEYPGPDRDLRR